MGTVTELEPRIVEEEPQEPVEPLEVDEEMDNNSLIDQQEVRDKLTGQTRLFEEDETEI